MSKRTSLNDSPLAQLFASTETAHEVASGTDETVHDEASTDVAPVIEADSDPVAPSSEHHASSPGTAASGSPIADAMADASTYLAVIRVVGVGGAGLNALERMMESDVRGVEFVAVNTDLQQLEISNAPVRLHIGNDLTGGLGSGADPAIGRSAAEASYDHIRHVLKGSDMVFVTCGEGGGTGTGAAPVVCRAARELGALTVAIVTTPFAFEGSRRNRAALDGMKALREAADTVIVIPNNRLLEVLQRDVSMIEAFRVADDVLRQGVQGICDLITMPGLINVDFADVRTIMSEAGSALMGIGFGTGENRAIDAANSAINSPLIEQPASGAHGILLSISGGDDLSLHEVTEAARIIQEHASDDANIIFGATVDSRLTGQVWVTVVATNFVNDPHRVAKEHRGRILGSRTAASGASTTSSSDSDIELPAFLQ